MVDISITAANVVPGSNATRESGTAGETITAGKVVYRASATGKYMLADSNSATAEARTPRGIALNGASNGQPLQILRSGEITIGGTLDPEAPAYYLSDTPGGICPVADIGNGEYICLIGLAKSATVLDIAIKATGVAYAT
ncbi:MAG: hypothetical protein ACK4U0_19215 [Mesorhizobium sp.]